MAGAPPKGGWSGLRANAGVVLGSFLFRWCCFLLMLYLALLAEARPAPSLPDAVLARVPYVGWIDRYNYVVWMVAYVPVALLFLWRDARRFARYMVTAGIVAVARGLCILATGLGPVRGGDVNAGLSAELRWRAMWELANPVAVFAKGTPAAYLTKDLFFSGHTSTTLILLLYVWRYPGLRAAMIAGHALVVATIFLSHLHYTIDVIGAYAIAFSLYVLRESELRAVLAGRGA